MRRYALLVTLLLVLGACREADKPAPSSTTTSSPPTTSIRPLPEEGDPSVPPNSVESGYRFTGEQMQPIILRGADLGDTWVESGDILVAQAQAPRCVGEVSPEHQEDPQSFSTLSVAGPTLVNSTADIFVNSAVAAYKTVEIANVDRASAMREDVLDCLLEEFVSSLETDPRFAEYQVTDSSRRSLDAVLDGIGGSGVLYTVALLRDDSALLVSSATFIIGSGPLTATIGVVGFGPFDTSFLRTALESVRDRLDALEVREPTGTG